MSRPRVCSVVAEVTVHDATPTHPKRLRDLLNAPRTFAVVPGEAVRGISLRVRAGEVFGILGPDGTGSRRRCED
jgi:ABC-type multidrug transport system ATPase subunit